MKPRHYILIFFAVILLFSTNNTNAQDWNIVGSGANAFFAKQGMTSICADYIGNVYVAGYFVDTVPSHHYYVAKWNGSRWEELSHYDSTSFDLLHGNPLFSDWVLSICTDRSGYLYASGGIGFDSINHYSVAKWDGLYWHKLGAGTNSLISNSDITTVVTDTLNNLYAGGIFISESAGVNDTFYLAKWDGVSWSKTDDKFAVSQLSVDAANNLYGVGYFTDNPTHQCVAKWNGIAWQELGTGSSALNMTQINAICPDYAGNVYAGVFEYSSFTNYLAKWDGTSWVHTGLNCNSNIMSLGNDKHNNIYIGGTFSVTFNDSFSKFDVIKYDGISFTPLGTPFQTTPDTNVLFDIAEDGFHAICLDTAGNLYGALWMGKSHPPGDSVYLYADSFYVVRYGTAFTIDTTILPPPDTTDVAPVDTATRTATIMNAPGLISVYPIPAHDLIHIETDHAFYGARYYIFDCDGRCVQSAGLSAHKNIVGISDLPAGAYFLQVGNKRENVFRIIKE